MATLCSGFRILARSQGQGAARLGNSSKSSYRPEWPVRESDISRPREIRPSLPCSTPLGCHRNTTQKTRPNEDYSCISYTKKKLPRDKVAFYSFPLFKINALEEDRRTNKSTVHANTTTQKSGKTGVYTLISETRPQSLHLTQSCRTAQESKKPSQFSKSHDPRLCARCNSMTRFRGEIKVQSEPPNQSSSEPAEKLLFSKLGTRPPEKLIGISENSEVRFNNSAPLRATGDVKMKQNKMLQHNDAHSNIHSSAEHYKVISSSKLFKRSDATNQPRNQPSFKLYTNFSSSKMKTSRSPAKLYGSRNNMEVNHRKKALHPTLREVSQNKLNTTSNTNLKSSPGVNNNAVHIDSAAHKSSKTYYEVRGRYPFVASDFKTRGIPFTGKGSIPLEAEVSWMFLLRLSSGPPEPFTKPKDSLRAWNTGIPKELQVLKWKIREGLNTQPQKLRLIEQYNSVDRGLSRDGTSMSYWGKEEATRRGVPENFHTHGSMAVAGSVFQAAHFSEKSSRNRWTTTTSPEHDQKPRQM